MDPWNCCCNINCLAKMHYTFIFNHWRVSKLSGEKELCKQRAKQGDDGAGRCNFKRQMMGCQQAQMRECELVRCQLMHGHTFLLAAWAPTPQAFKKERIGARPFKPPSNPESIQCRVIVLPCVQRAPYVHLCGGGVQRHAVFRHRIPLWWKWRRPHNKTLLWSCLSDLSQTWSWEQLSSLMAADHDTFWLPIMYYVSQVSHMYTANCPVGHYALAPPLVIVWGQSTAQSPYSPVCLDSQLHADEAWMQNDSQPTSGQSGNKTSLQCTVEALQQHQHQAGWLALFFSFLF